MSIVQHLDKIEVFVAVAEAGSLHAAARRLNLSQPALTQTLKTLERVCDCQLLNRSRDGSELTTAGQRFYDSAIQILKEARQLEYALSRSKVSSRQSLRVGMVESIAIYAWPNAQAFLKTQLSNLETVSAGTKYDLYTGRTDALLKRLSASEIDAAVVVDPVCAPTHTKEFLYQDSFYLYCSPDDAGRSVVEKGKKRNSSVDRPLFLFDSARISGDESLRTCAEALPVQFETINIVDSFEVASEFVRAGLGFALLPERVALKHKLGLRQVLVLGQSQPPIATHSIYACAFQSTALLPSFQLLCEALRNT